MSADTFAKIGIELSALKKLQIKYSALRDQIKTQEPSDVELLAVAGILHSFYSGFENVFKRIAQELDGGFTKSASWHVDLLESMAKSTLTRSAVISDNLKLRLQSYLSFRHVFRSNYSYDLNWLKMQDLFFESEEVLSLVEKELNQFMNGNKNTQ